ERIGGKDLSRKQHERLFGGEPDRREGGGRGVGELLVERRGVGGRPDRAEQHPKTVRHRVRPAGHTDQARGRAQRFSPPHPAAPTFPTITCWPRISLNRGVMTRAITSKEPPAANGTTKVMGRVG